MNLVLRDDLAHLSGIDPAWDDDAIERQWRTWEQCWLAGRKVSLWPHLHCPRPPARPRRLRIRVRYKKPLGWVDPNGAVAGPIPSWLAALPVREIDSGGPLPSPWPRASHWDPVRGVGFGTWYAPEAKTKRSPKARRGGL